MTARRFRLVVALSLSIGSMAISRAQTPLPSATPPSAAMPSAALLQHAALEEAAYRFEAAIDSLFTLVLEHPRTAEALAGRLQLARLLALAGDLPAAMSQSQAARDEAPPTAPEREAALNLSTTLARRLRSRAGASGYTLPEAIGARGLTALDEPTALLLEPAGSMVLLDQGSQRIYRIATGAATAIAAVEPTGAALLPDGLLAIAARGGLTAPGSTKPLPANGSWGGRTRPLRRVRAMAANPHGDLFIVDRDFDGLLRCDAGATVCNPWGPVGRLRTVKVGVSGYAYLLDDRQQTVRVLDSSGKQVGTVGPMLGNTRLERVVDIALDDAYGLYLLDAAASRIHVMALRSPSDAPLVVEQVATLVIPMDGERSLRGAAAISVAPDGAITVVGRPAPRLLRFQ